MPAVEVGTVPPRDQLIVASLIGIEEWFTIGGLHQRLRAADRTDSPPSHMRVTAAAVGRTVRRLHDEGALEQRQHEKDGRSFEYRWKPEWLVTIVVPGAGVGGSPPAPGAAPAPHREE